MNRRAFFSVLAGAAAASYDPERALWVPGRKLISIPTIVRPASLGVDLADTVSATLVQEWRREPDGWRITEFWKHAPDTVTTRFSPGLFPFAFLGRSARVAESRTLR